MVHPPLFLYLTKTNTKHYLKMRENMDMHLLWFNLMFKTLVFCEYLPHYGLNRQKPKS